jgi:hypothetical protein
VIGLRTVSNVAARTSSEERRRIILLVVGAAVVLRFAIALALTHKGPSAGAWSFHDLSHLSGRPYADFQVAYPVVMFGFLKLIGVITSSLYEYWVVLIWLNVAAELGIAYVLLRGWGTSSACFYLLAAAPMMVVIDGTADTLSTLLAVTAVALWVTRRPLASGAAFALAVLSKLWPLPLGLLVLRRTQASARFLVGAVAIGVVGGGVWVAFDGVHAVSQVVSYGGAKGWEIETAPGLVLLAVHGAGAVYQESGASRIGEVAEPIRWLLLVASLGGAGWGLLRGLRVGSLGLGWLVSTMSVLVFATLLSPQFVLWAIPAAAIAWHEGHRLPALLTAAATTLTGLVVARWQWVYEAKPAWLALLGLRNVLLIAVLVVGAVTLWRSCEPVLEGLATDTDEVEPREPEAVPSLT